MARNGSGTYSLPAGNPVVTGSTISSTWANNTLADIATAITQSLSADGQTPITADFPFNNNKATGLAAGTTSGDALAYGQPGASLTSPNFTGTPTANSTELGFRPIPRSTTTTTATTADRGKCIAISAGMTIPNATFAAGDSFSLYNDSGSSVTVTQGAGLTLRYAGTALTGNRTLVQRGLCTIWFNTASEAIISGQGLT